MRKHSPVFDIADGWVARKQKKHSPWGSDLDSLADVITFCVAPAVLGFTLGLRGLWDSILLAFFVFCGVARLARYNVTSAMMADHTGKVKYYEGFPVPTSLAIVTALIVAYARGEVFEHLWFGHVKFLDRTFHPFSLIYGLWGCLMVSASLKIPKP